MSNVKDQKIAKAAIVLSSESDLSIMDKCISVLKDFGVQVDVIVCQPEKKSCLAAEYAKKFEANGTQVIIAVTGESMVLLESLAASTVIPVIGVPIKSSAIEDISMLLAMVRMPKGLPAASVAINGGENAALLAVQILGAFHPELRDKMHKYKNKLAENVAEKNRALKEKTIYR